MHYDGTLQIYFNDIETQWDLGVQNPMDINNVVKWCFYTMTASICAQLGQNNPNIVCCRRQRWCISYWWFDFFPANKSNGGLQQYTGPMIAIEPYSAVEYDRRQSKSTVEDELNGWINNRRILFGVVETSQEISFSLTKHAVTEKALGNLAISYIRIFTHDGLQEFHTKLITTM